MYCRWSSVVLFLLKNGNGNSRLENKVRARINNASWSKNVFNDDKFSGILQSLRDNVEISEQCSVNDIEIMYTFKRQF